MTRAVPHILGQVSSIFGCTIHEAIEYSIRGYIYMNDCCDYCNVDRSNIKLACSTRHLNGKRFMRSSILRVHMILTSIMYKHVTV